MQRTTDLFEVDNNAKASDELDLLLILIKDYEGRHIHLPAVSPIEGIKLKMEK